MRTQVGQFLRNASLVGVGDGSDLDAGHGVARWPSPCVWSQSLTNEQRPEAGIKQNRRKFMFKKNITSSEIVPAASLSDKELEGVVGGNSIEKFPSPNRPKLHVPGSIAQGEINSNSTDDNLSDSGGDGIIS
jgi:hypothetical protein